MLNVEVGKTVMILARSGTWRQGEYEPVRLETITKITPKQIHVGRDGVFDREGMPRDRFSRFAKYKLSDDQTLLDEMVARNDARRQEREAAEAAAAERDARPTYQLACRITGWGDYDITRADLELLGEEYLQRIVDDITRLKGTAA